MKVLFISTTSVDSDTPCSFENLQIHKGHKFSKISMFYVRYKTRLIFKKKVVIVPNLSVFYGQMTNIVLQVQVRN